MDNLIQSPISDSNACYVTKLNDDVTSYLDFGSGFTTTSLMVENSEAVKAAIETSPDLFKDIRVKDNEGKIWFPATITVPNSGMVFADGTSKVDMSSIKRFPKEKGFIDALDEIGFFGIDFTKPVS